MPLTGKVLLVSDPHQGKQAEELVRRRLPGVELVVAIWDRGTRKDAVRRTIRQSGPFEALFSFNNDLVFQDLDLETVLLAEVGSNGTARTVLPAYNVHPSLVRGMGYGTTPLYEDFRTHGAVAHFIAKGQPIDSGEIFDFIEVPLPSTANFRQLRLRTHLIALALFNRLLARLAGHESWRDAHAEMAELPAKLGRAWSDRYVSVAERDAALLKLLETNPGHRVFQGMPMEGGIPLSGTPENIAEVPADLSDLDALLAPHSG